MALFLECANDCQGNRHNNEAADVEIDKDIDMEVDMVGGRFVGVVDEAISKDSSRGVWGTSEKEIVEEITPQKSVGKILAVKEDINSTLKQLLLERIHEDCNDSDSVAKSIQKIKSKLSAERILQRSPGKWLNAREEMGIPPGFEKLSNSEILPCKPTYTEGEDCLNDGRDMSHVMRENMALQVVGGRDFGARSPRPQSFMEASNLKGSVKHLEPARGFANDHLAAYPSPLLDKDGISELKIKGGGNGVEKPVEVEEQKVLSGTPICNEGTSQSTAGSTNGGISERKQNGYLQSVKMTTEAHKFNELHTKSPNMVEVSICWTPPPKNWVKLNTQGFSQGHPGSARAAGVIRDESGKWLMGYNLDVQRNENSAADFWALYQGLQLVWDRGYKKVMVECVSSLVVEYLKEAHTPFDPNTAIDDPDRAIVECCKDLLNREWTCKVNHIHRKANSCAHWLATQCEDCKGLTLFKNPPPELVPIMQNDCAGIAGSRYLSSHS